MLGTTSITRPIWGYRKTKGIRESTESVDRRNLVCRSVALIYVEFWGLKKGYFGPGEKSGFASATQKGEFLKMAKWGNFGGVWSNNDKG